MRREELGRRGEVDYDGVIRIGTERGRGSRERRREFEELRESVKGSGRWWFEGWWTGIQSWSR